MAALLQLVSPAKRPSPERRPRVDGSSEAALCPDIIREQVVRTPGSLGASTIFSHTAKPSLSSSPFVDGDRPVRDRDPATVALDELRLSAIPMEDVERIEALVDSLIERGQDPEALVDLLAGISLQATTVAAIVKDYARLRCMVETRSYT
jgi:hypothetical protein